MLWYEISKILKASSFLQTTMRMEIMGLCWVEKLWQYLIPALPYSSSALRYEMWQCAGVSCVMMIEKMVSGHKDVFLSQSLNYLVCLGNTRWFTAIAYCYSAGVLCSYICSWYMLRGCIPVLPHIMFLLLFSYLCVKS